MAESMKGVTEPFKLDNIYMVVARCPNGDEGIAARLTEQGMLPLVFSTLKVMGAVFDDEDGMLADLARESGSDILVCKFRRVEVIKTIKA